MKGYNHRPNYKWTASYIQYRGQQPTSSLQQLKPNTKEAQKPTDGPKHGCLPSQPNDGNKSDLRKKENKATNPPNTNKDPWTVKRSKRPRKDTQAPGQARQWTLRNTTLRNTTTSSEKEAHTGKQKTPGAASRCTSKGTTLREK